MATHLTIYPSIHHLLGTYLAKEWDILMKGMVLALATYCDLGGKLEMLLLLEAS